MNKNSYWITMNGANKGNYILLFRKKFCSEGKSLLARVSADSRYKLYLNGRLVSMGPCKGTGSVTYYEEVDLSVYLKKGENELLASVLHLDDNCIKPPTILSSVMRKRQAVFLFYGILDEDKLLVTDNSWETCQEESVTIEKPVYAIFASLNETYRRREYYWQQSEEYAVCHLQDDCSNSWGELDAYVLRKREIPPMSVETQEVLLSDVEIQPFTNKMFILDAKELVTAYITVRAEQGKSGHIRMTYGECYVHMENGKWVKRMRDDISGDIIGDYDTIYCDGRMIQYDSYWFKTFRYIRVDAQAGLEPLRIHEISYQQTHYPLDIEGDFCCSSEEYNLMWDISLRTLRNCMHETFEDCPYYEQLQYIMDTRLQMLFTYGLSRDYKLQKKAIQDFAQSRMPEGLLDSRSPSMNRQVIPGFSLHFIFLLEDYYIYTGDRDTVWQQIPVVDGILNWFRMRLNVSGIVGATGYWPFMDWVENWGHGVPCGNYDSPLTVYSLMLAAALESASHLVRAVVPGRNGEEYVRWRQELIQHVNASCYDRDRKMYADIPGGSTFSEHCQIWAILSGTIEAAMARELMLRTISESVSRCSFSMRFYAIRALEKAGLYYLTDELYEDWRKMMELHCTTWPETPVSPRSECHGWSAVMLYEFPRMILGVKQEEEKIGICPYFGGLTWAKGTVSTKYGKLRIEWKIEGGEPVVKIDGDEAALKHVVLDD